MTVRQCRAPGCTGRTSRYGHYCSTHKARLRRHGAVDQDGVTKAELRPYLATVRARIKKNADNPAWAMCEARWGDVIGHAEAVLAAHQGGKAGYRWERMAAAEVVKLAGAVAPREVIETVLALYVFLDREPRRFKSDNAFSTQLVRRVRGLTDINTGTWLDHSTGKAKSAYREVTPKASMMFAHWIAKSLGGVGVYLAKIERQQDDERQRGQAAMAAALSEIK